MPTFTYIGTVQANVKVLSLWNGTTNDPFPAGWRDSGFDDSGWSTSANPAVDSVQDRRYPNGVDPFVFTPGVLEAIAPSTRPVHADEWWLCRMHFTTPAAPHRYYNMERRMPGHGIIFGDSDHVFPELNGNRISIFPPFASGFPVAASYPPSSQALMESYFAAAGGDNLLTWSLISGSPRWQGTPLEGWDAWWIVFYIPDTGGIPVAWGTIDVGVNDRGVLGTGDDVSHLTPTIMDLSAFPDPEAPAVVKIASNGRTTLLLDAYGSVYACGDNEGGMALASGTSDTGQHLAPVSIDTAIATIFATTVVGRIVDISVGGDCVMLLDRVGTVTTWGINTYGSVGNGTTSPQLSPYPFVGNLALAVSAGRNHAGYNRWFGSPHMAGANDRGQLGLGHTTSPVTTLTEALSIADDPLVIGCGDERTVLVTTGGSYACGNADNDSLGPILSGTVTSLSNAALSGTPLAQVGAITFESLNFGSIDTTSIRGWGDDDPYGGLGNAGAGSGSAVIVAHPVSGLPTTTILRQTEAPVFAGGIVNQWAAADSKVTFGAVALEHTLVTCVEESLTGQALDPGTTTNLWVSDGSVYELPPGVVWVRVFLQNVSGGATNRTVRILVEWYDSPTNMFSDELSDPIVVGTSGTFTLESPVTNPHGVKVKMTHGPTGTNTVNVTFTAYCAESSTARLYTWGYGGYGQMGSGADAASNPYAISTNGLFGVVSATFAERVAFAIAEGGGTPLPTSRGRSFVLLAGI